MSDAKLECWDEHIVHEGLVIGLVDYHLFHKVILLLSGVLAVQKVDGVLKLVDRLLNQGQALILVFVVRNEKLNQEIESLEPLPFLFNMIDNMVTQDACIFLLLLGRAWLFVKMGIHEGIYPITTLFLLISCVLEAQIDVSFDFFGLVLSNILEAQEKLLLLHFFFLLLLRRAIRVELVHIDQWVLVEVLSQQQL